MYSMEQRGNDASSMMLYEDGVRYLITIFAVRRVLPTSSYVRIKWMTRNNTRKFSRDELCNKCKMLKKNKCEKKVGISIQ